MVSKISEISFEVKNDTLQNPMHMIGIWVYFLNIFKFIKIDKNEKVV